MIFRLIAMVCLLSTAPVAAQVTIESESLYAGTPAKTVYRWDTVDDFVGNAGASSQLLPTATAAGALVGHSSDRSGRFHVLVDRGVQPGPGRFTYEVFANEAAYRTGIVQETATIDLVLARDSALAFAIDPTDGFHLIVDQFQSDTDLYFSWSDRAAFLAGPATTSSTLRRSAAGCVLACRVAGLSFDRTGQVHLLNETETTVPGERLLTLFTYSDETAFLNGEPVVRPVAFAPPPGTRVAGFDVSLAPVPEPGTWALMIGGFWFVGITARTRRARPVSRRAL